MAHISPSGQSNSPPLIRPVCVSANSHGAPSSEVGLLVQLDGHVVKRAGLPRDQPLEREGVKQCERPARLVLHTDCDSYCAGSWECLLPV